MLCACFAFAAEDVSTAVAGTVKKIDSAAKTISVKTTDGAEHTFRFVDRTVVHGTEKMEQGAKDAFHGLKEGSEVAVHYTVKGSEKIAEEVDGIGRDGLRTAHGTLRAIDREGKTIKVRTDSGAEETYRLGDRCARDTGKDIEEAAKKSVNVTVYYSEEAGHKVAHFFKTTS
jgi:hypothetical protein